MISTLSFGQPPPQAHARLSISSSPQPSMASSSESPMNTPTFDPNAPSFTDSRSVSDEIVPKVEQLEVDLEDVKPAPIVEEPPISPTTLQGRRKRGRPRKYPRDPPEPPIKPVKGRSKTGCLTCRRRKKKCDETKPFCNFSSGLSCQKNNVHCEGYKPKEIWKSGKEREEDARRSSIEVRYDLPILMEGVENDMDRYILQHFIDSASRVLSLHSGTDNPFTRILLPMAFKHRGLMHSVLCLSASHLSSIQPDKGYEERQSYHRGEAIHLLNMDLARHNSGEADSMFYEDSNVAQVLVHLLHSICEGDTSGEYRAHMEGAKMLIQTQKSQNVEFQNLFDEFFFYHYVASTITSLESRDVLMMEDFKLPFQIGPEAGALVGVIDGLFGFISKISNLRRKIRRRIDNHEEPLVDYEGFADVHAIDTGLRGWICPQTPGTPRYTASMLYKQATWVYLYRTTKPSRPDPHINRAVDDGIAYLNQLPADGPTQSVLLMPLFLIACAAFEPEQRTEINRAFDGLMAYSALKNIRAAKDVVDKVWELMDAGDEESWDWEKIIHSRGWDFLIT
ncbi:hypothetical protein K469DRAFT_722628 [Zopfia rhizophila CBS 207.26]|uniref:Zn(2)-C6 fungal-type domain-containing protein n=1 Tax=Zopfia rhizophila CBS 207.26 TaxID=1314779 RepID=A0A6A6ETB0_9PEZI|nr:hypothetical protein K469DRAFT_722628 [Zopfia rhizophila CBS 207.26]